MLWKFLHPVAFKLSAHLGMASYTVNAYVKQSYLGSLFWWRDSVPICAEDCDL